MYNIASFSGNTLICQLGKDSRTGCGIVKQIVRACLTVDIVVTVTAAECIVSVATHQRIVTATSPENIVCRTPFETVVRIIPFNSVHLISSNYIFNCINELFITKPVILHSVGRLISVALCPEEINIDPLRTCRIVDRITATVTDKPITSFQSRERIVSLSATQCIDTRTTFNRIIVGTSGRVFDISEGISTALAINCRSDQSVSFIVISVEIDRHILIVDAVVYGIVIRTAVERITSKTPLKGVVTTLRFDHIIIIISDNDIAATAPFVVFDPADRIFKCSVDFNISALQICIDHFASQRIIHKVSATRFTIDRIFPGTTDESIVFRTSVKGIVSGTSDKGVFIRASFEDIRRIVSSQIICFVTSDHIFDIGNRIISVIVMNMLCGCPGKIDRDTTATAKRFMRIVKCVVSYTAIDNIISFCSDNRIVTTFSIDAIRRIISGQNIASLTCRNIFNLIEIVKTDIGTVGRSLCRTVGQCYRHTLRFATIIDCIVSVTTVNFIIVGTADQDIVTCTASERIFPAVTIEGVISGITVESIHFTVTVQRIRSRVTVQQIFSHTAG